MTSRRCCCASWPSGNRSAAGSGWSTGPLHRCPPRQGQGQALTSTDGQCRSPVELGCEGEAMSERIKLCTLSVAPFARRRFDGSQAGLGAARNRWLRGPGRWVWPRHNRPLRRAPGRRRAALPAARAAGRQRNEAKGSGMMHDIVLSAVRTGTANMAPPTRLPVRTADSMRGSWCSWWASAALHSAPNAMTVGVHHQRREQGHCAARQAPLCHGWAFNRG